MGPWPHGIGGRSCGDLDFGTEAVFDREALVLRWLDHWLKGEDTGLLEELPAVKLFITGENSWRGFTQWPPTEAVDRLLYLRSGGRANSMFGDGALDDAPAASETPDGFDYDPDNPVPTLGGQHIGIPECPPGPIDQRPIERRDDVLVYSSGPLTQPLTVVGHPRVVLHVSSSAPDTDFTAKLVDVWPDGRALILTDGILRARYRSGFAREEMLEPGTVYELTVDAGAVAHTFLPGHRIRLDISSSNFPRFDRNLNTGEPVATADRWQIAHQTVFHDRERPSHLLLPVVSEGRGTGLRDSATASPSGQGRGSR